MITREKTKRSNLPGISLSERLDQVEIQISKLGPESNVQAEDILHGLDEIRARLDYVKNQGRIAKGEESQFEFLCLILKKESRAFLDKIGGTKGLASHRSKRQPDEKDWWWYLDEFYAQQRKAFLKRRWIWLASMAAVLVIFGLGYNRFLAPSPAAQAAMTFEFEIQKFLAKGDFSSSLNKAALALAVDPDNVTILIMKGIAQLKLGETSEGNQTEAKAEQLAGDQESFLLQRALIYLRAGDSISVLSDAQAIIAINPESAEGYFFKGMAYGPSSIQPDEVKAQEAFVTARKLAMAQDKTTLILAIQLHMTTIPLDSELKQ